MTNKFQMQDDSRGNYDDVFYLKMITKKDENPRFTIKVKEGSEYKEIGITQSISGNLKNIEFSEYQWEKETIKTVKFLLDKKTEESNQLSILSCSYTSTLRSVINSILGCNVQIEKLSMTIGRNKDGYAQVFTLINGKKTEWKYQYDFLKTMIETEQTKKGPLVYYDKLDQFLQDELQKHLSVIIPGSLNITDEPEGETNMDDFDPEFPPDDVDKFFEQESTNKKKKK